MAPSGSTSSPPIPDELATTLAGLPKAERTRLLEMLFMTADAAFWTIDVDARTVAFSRGLDMILGHHAEALRSFDAVEVLLHPEDHDRVVKGVRAAKQSGAASWTDEFRSARADGTYAVVRARAAFLRERGRLRRMIGALVDVSRVAALDAELDAQAEELIDRSAEARSERIRRELVERAVGDAVREWDLAADTCSWNDAVHELFGYARGEVGASGDWWRDRIHPDDRDRVDGALARLFEGAEDAWADTYRFRGAHGTYFHVRDRGSVMRDADGRALRLVGAMRPMPPVPDDRDRASDLTVRQAEVLALIRRGLSNKEIAARLGIGEQAVKEHVSRMLERTGARNRTALVELAATTDLALVEVGPDDAVADVAVGVAVLRGPTHVIAALDGRFREAAHHRDVFGPPLREALPALAGQGIIELADHVLLTGRTYAAPEVVLRTEEGGRPMVRTGSLRAVPVRNAHGALDGVLVVAVETTDRRTERRGPLRLARQQVLSMRGWPIGAVLVDASGRILDMNDAAAGAPAAARATAMDLARTALASDRPLVERRRVAGALLSASASPVRDAGRVVAATVTFAVVRAPR